MMLNAPVVPGLTQSAEGSPNTKLLNQLILMKNKDVEALLNSMRKLFTPTEPPPEPTHLAAQPPAFGQALSGLVGQPQFGQPQGSLGQ